MDVPVAVGRGNSRCHWWTGNGQLRIAESVAISIRIGQSVKLGVTFGKSVVVHIEFGKPVVVCIAFGVISRRLQLPAVGVLGRQLHIFVSKEFLCR